MEADNFYEMDYPEFILERALLEARQDDICEQLEDRLPLMLSSSLKLQLRAIQLRLAAIDTMLSLDNTLNTKF